MKNKNYHTDKQWYLFITILVLIGTISVISSNPKVIGSDSFWLLVTFFILFLLDAYIGMYISIENNTLIRTSHFFFRRKLDIKDIKNISYRPTWIVGGGLGYSLWIIGIGEKRPARIEIANVGYSNNVISEILCSLIELNPQIVLDQGTKRLIGNYKNPEKA